MSAKQGAIARALSRCREEVEVDQTRRHKTRLLLTQSNRSPLVTYARVLKTGIVGVWDRAGCAQLSGAKS